MFQPCHTRVSHAFRYFFLMAALMMLLFLGACAKKPEAAPAPTSPQTFASAEDAGKELLQAAQSQNKGALLTIFGPGSEDLIYTGDAVEDKSSFAGFAKAYNGHASLAQFPGWQRSIAGGS